MRAFTARCTLALCLAIARPAAAQHELGKARAMTVAGGILSTLGLSAFTAGVGIALATPRGPCGCGETFGLLVLPLLTVGGAHLGVGVPVFTVGEIRLRRALAELGLR